MRGNDPKPHRNLVAWQKGMDLVMEVYSLTKNFPERELYGLSSQLPRAALSVPSNIAEGAADRTQAHFSHFLSNALGSLNEIDTQLELSFRLGYISEIKYQHISRLLDECLAVNLWPEKIRCCQDKTLNSSQLTAHCLGKEIADEKSGQSGLADPHHDFGFVRTYWRGGRSGKADQRPNTLSADCYKFHDR